MITFGPAREDQYDEFLKLMQEQAQEYLEFSLRLIGFTLKQYEEKFRTVGSVYGIYQDGNPAGFYWIEKRHRTLHIHALILKSEYQGQGIGTQVFEEIHKEYGEGVDTFELGVHFSNIKAKSLYERLGYRTAAVRDDVDFFIMRRPSPRS